MKTRVLKDVEGWKKKLSLEQYRVLREKGTEQAFSGKLLHKNGEGMYVCAGCGASLFSSETKFDSGTGWPSFSSVVDKGAVELKKDYSHGMHRVEVICKKCGGHLGHVFEDGSTPTGKRFCINSCALGFRKK